jgi:hypothetical protein
MVYKFIMENPFEMDDLGVPQIQWIFFRENLNRKPWIFPFFIWGLNQ